VPEKAQQMQEATPEAFNQALCMAFDNRLGLCTLESERQVFPLPVATRVSLRRTVWRWWAMRRIPFIRWPGRALILALWMRRSWLMCVACIAKAKISASISTCVATSAAASTARLMLAGMQGFRELFAGNPAKKLLRDIGLKLADTNRNSFVRRWVLTICRTGCVNRPSHFLFPASAPGNSLV
jgi:2-octaprenylphenol hydroxylase